METWGPDRAAELAGLVDAAMPAEALSADELLGCCWEDPGIVLATADGCGAVAAVLRDGSAGPDAYVKVLAVHPGARRDGLGRDLLVAAEDWAWSEGATRMHLGGSAPFYLWPGVDVRALAMLCLAESAGYRPVGAAMNMSVPATFRAPVPDGLELRRVLDDDDVSAVESFVTRLWPNWWPEARRAVEQGTCLATFDAGGGGEGRVIAFACHSVNRAAWFGPTGTDPTRRRTGAGLALLSEVAKDLMVAGYPDIEISWIGPVGFYAAAGGAISRIFRSLSKPRP